jgi:hypothetical protein
VGLEKRVRERVRERVQEGEHGPATNRAAFTSGGPNRPRKVADSHFLPLHSRVDGSVFSGVGEWQNSLPCRGIHLRRVHVGSVGSPNSDLRNSEPRHGNHCPEYQSCVSVWTLTYVCTRRFRRVTARRRDTLSGWHSSLRQVCRSSLGACDWRRKHFEQIVSLKK